ncbi:TetR family transcriptional regulator [Gilvimarinus sp. SDUM040013]|uniref:TetR family transcriptional regulator n=1 Tax=Gilvimarinus gilvus TaxID=3058038 RepID=A0ABU4S3N6_9GAMM|nr:TetR/AcrR family transcriptional regulator [Gilvimarinus sp. SDUM040013]MDO3385858.1 TetR family transcriptional regulator [Gilvimarinus sp. SDUM040013]MDX6851151.1 TetR family transcriptional regulator [Gilvimarinus sp. SDUM040013]
MSTDNSRNQILDAAQTLFYQRGFHATSISDIANKAGVFKGNLAYYFKSKQSLLQAVADNRLAQLEETLAGFANFATPRERLSAFIGMVEDTRKNLARHGCPMGSLSTEIGKTSLPKEHTRALLDYCLNWLHGEFNKIEPKSAKQHAETLLAMAQGTALLAHNFNNEELVRRQCQAMHQWLRVITD